MYHDTASTANLLQSEKIILDNDYEGSVSAKGDYFEVTGANSAVVYVHGYMDYFFQSHLADFFIDRGISFYAVELRKYGSSLQEHHHPNFCKDVREYYKEISTIVHKAKERGHQNIILHGHSTGGLIATHYLLHSPDKALISAVILNSPFFAFNASKSAKSLLPLITPLGKFLPYLKFTRLPSINTESLHKDYRGRWDFNLDYKPVPSFFTYLGWMRAIFRAQQEVYNKTVDTLPSLVLHSSQSCFKSEWSKEVFRSDVVLNVEDIGFYAKQIYQNVTVVAIENAVHDIVLSEDTVIENYFAEISQWLEKHHQL